MAAGTTPCPKCKNPVEQNVKFCPTCGYDVSGIWSQNQNPQLAGSIAIESDPNVDVLGQMLSEATLGDYDIYGELGRGGMAAVYLGLDLALNRKVAIKTMLPELVPREGMVSRFKREAQTAAGLSHPHIIQIYTVKETASLVFFVMKFIEGRSLESVINDKGKVPLTMAQTILGQVASALDYAHSRHVVHRDIKPANIMIDEDGWAIVTDFGIAKVQEAQNLTATGTAIGTPHYMSPEQFHNKAVTGLCDQYSLGVVAYEMLTGKKPFDGGTYAEIITQHLFEAPPRVRAINPDIPQHVEDAITKMLAKDPADRFPDVDAAIRAFGAPSSPDTVRSQMISLAKAGPQKKLRLSVPMSAVPSSKPKPAVTSSTRFDPDSKKDAGNGGAVRSPIQGWGAIATGAFAVVGIYALVQGILVSGASQNDVERVLRVVGFAAGVALLLFALAALSVKLWRFMTTPSKAAPAPAGAKPAPIPAPKPQAAAPKSAAAPQVSANPPAPAPQPPASGASILIERPPGDERSTRVVKDIDWLKPPEPTRRPSGARAIESEGTGVFMADGAGQAIKNFPVAVVIKDAVDAGSIGRRMKCDHFPFTIGRDKGADLSIPGDESLSSIHAEVDVDENGFLIRDKSRNGSHVDGKRLNNSSDPLRIGAEIKLSPSTVVTFVADIPRLPDLTGSVVAGRYKLEKRLHDSFKAATYKATDANLPWTLAIKIFSPSLMKLPHYRSEFKRQADLAVRIKHPHICRIIEWHETEIEIEGRRERIAYLCSEYMLGGSLSTKLQKDEQFDPLAVARWIGMVAAALNQAHDGGIMHGDLKPACILFDEQGLPYVADFALGAESASKTKAVIGSPDYLAPERWEGDKPTAKSDQYSLAVITHLMLTGVTPYEGQSDPKVRARNFRRGPLPVHEEAESNGRKGLARSISPVVAKGMHSDPEQRYESVRAFATSLMDAVSGKVEPEAPRIFLSYQRSTGSGWINTLSFVFREAKFQFFVDSQAVDGSPDVPDRIRDEIAKCNVFVCLLGPDTVQSEWVLKEIEIAVEMQKPLIPILLEGFDRKTVAKPTASFTKLVNQAGVKFLDKQNLYISAASEELVQQIKKRVATSTAAQS